MPTLNANMTAPTAVIADGSASYYVAAHYLFKIDGAGQLTVVARESGS